MSHLSESSHKGLHEFGTISGQRYMTDTRHYRTSLSCIRPAVSIRTTSKSLSRAGIKSEDYFYMTTGVNAYRILSLLSQSQRRLCHNLVRTIRRALCCPPLRQPRASQDCERELGVVLRRRSCECMVLSKGCCSLKS